MWPRNVARLVFIGWVISYANEWEDYFHYFGEGRFPGFGLLTTPWPFDSALEFAWHIWVYHFCLLVEDQGLVLSAILVPFDSNQFMLCPWATSFFQKLCSAPLPPVT